MDNEYYLSTLYPFQNQILSVIKELESPFYLTGGTALSRGYLNHRFSDDLDFFLDDNPDFNLWGDRFIKHLLANELWNLSVIQREERFVRLNINMDTVDLKIDLINDVPSRVGIPSLHPILGFLDTAENILANKVAAVLDRTAPKDLADIWGICTKLGLSLENAIQNAQGKAAGVFPLDLARVLCSVTRSDWDLIRWIESPDPDSYIKDLIRLGTELIK